MYKYPKAKSVDYLIDVVKPMIYTGKVFYSGRVGKYCPLYGWMLFEHPTHLIHS